MGWVGLGWVEIGVGVSGLGRGVGVLTSRVVPTVPAISRLKADHRRGGGVAHASKVHDSRLQQRPVPKPRRPRPLDTCVGHKIGSQAPISIQQEQASKKQPTSTQQATNKHPTGNQPATNRQPTGNQPTGSQPATNRQWAPCRVHHTAPVWGGTEL